MQLFDKNTRFDELEKAMLHRMVRYSTSLIFPISLRKILVGQFTTKTLAARLVVAATRAIGALFGNMNASV